MLTWLDGTSGLVVHARGRLAHLLGGRLLRVGGDLLRDCDPLLVQIIKAAKVRATHLGR